jgi:hypothetical protein
MPQKRGFAVLVWNAGTVVENADEIDAAVLISIVTAVAPASMEFSTSPLHTTTAGLRPRPRQSGLRYAAAVHDLWHSLLQ